MERMNSATPQETIILPSGEMARSRRNTARSTSIGEAARQERADEAAATMGRPSMTEKT